MKRLFLTLGLAFFAGTPAHAANQPESAMALGVEFALPYIIATDGDSVNERGNFNVGVDGRYHWTEAANFGLRVNFDIESRNGSKKQVSFAPGVQYRWLPGERWNPFVRFDVPVLLRDERDIGISGGSGLIWNLGNAIGVENMTARINFALNYFFGVGNAVNNVIALDLFNIGFDYHF